MINLLLNTSNEYVYLFVRLVAGIIILPYGVQKVFGWFENMDGPSGIKETLEQMKTKRVPRTVAWLIILGQSVGSVALILGFFGRIAAAGNFIIFTGALLVHAPDGWTMNWFGKKRGEGIEYFVMLLSMLLIIMVKGSGAISIDLWLQSIV